MLNRILNKYNSVSVTPITETTPLPVANNTLQPRQPLADTFTKTLGEVTQPTSTHQRAGDRLIINLENASTKAAHQLIDNFARFGADIHTEKLATDILPEINAFLASRSEATPASLQPVSQLQTAIDASMWLIKFGSTPEESEAIFAPTFREEGNKRLQGFKPEFMDGLGKQQQERLTEYREKNRYEADEPVEQDIVEKRRLYHATNQFLGSVELELQWAIRNIYSDVLHPDTLIIPELARSKKGNPILGLHNYHTLQESPPLAEADNLLYLSSAGKLQEKANTALGKIVPPEFISLVTTVPTEALNLNTDISTANVKIAKAIKQAHRDFYRE